MDAATWLSLVSAMAAVAACVAAWVSRRDFLASEMKRERAQLRAESERRKFELEAGFLRRSSAESLASLAKAFIEAKERERESPPIAAFSPQKKARVDFATELLDWVNRFERDVGDTRFYYADGLLKLSNRAHKEFEGNSALILAQSMSFLVSRVMIPGIGQPAPPEKQFADASDQMRYLIRAWVEDPDLFVEAMPSASPTHQ